MQLVRLFRCLLVKHSSGCLALFDRNNLSSKLKFSMYQKRLNLMVIWMKSLGRSLRNSILRKLWGLRRTIKRMRLSQILPQRMLTQILKRKSRIIKKRNVSLIKRKRFDFQYPVF